MNKTSSLASGGVAVAAIIALKLFAKTAIFASLFGGAAVAKNMYESSVMKVKGEVEEFNKKILANLYICMKIKKNWYLMTSLMMFQIVMWKMQIKTP